MNMTQAQSFRYRRHLAGGLLALAVLSAAMCLMFVFQAGCTADLKSMVSGDVERALQLEDYAVMMASVSAIAADIAFCMTSKSDNRALLGGALALFLLTGLWIAGICVGFESVRSCSS